MEERKKKLSDMKLRKRENKEIAERDQKTMDRKH